MNTTMSTDASRDFANHLIQLVHAGDRRTLAVFRRSLDGRGMSLTAISLLARVGAPVDNPKSLADHQLVAGLFALYNRGSTTDAYAAGDLGWSFGRMAAKSSSDGAERRFTVLLEAPRLDLDGHLRRGVSLLRAKDVPIDWASLLEGIRAWSIPEHLTQDSWALSFVNANTKGKD